MLSPHLRPSLHLVCSFEVLRLEFCIHISFPLRATCHAHLILDLVVVVVVVVIAHNKKSATV